MMLTDQRGKVQESYTYEAFGATWDGSLSRGNPLGYTGQRIDPVTGLNDYGYRDYSPQAGRWTTLDPIKAGENWYAYVNDDPINYVDPFGLDASDKRIGYRIGSFFPGVQMPPLTPLNLMNQGYSEQEIDRIMKEQAAGSAVDVAAETAVAGVVFAPEIAAAAGTAGS